MKNKRNKNASSGRLSIIVIGALLAAGLTGCKKWLNVTPQDKVPQSTLFTNEQGFKDAMTGVYLDMDKSTAGGSTGIYTNDLSMGILSVMGYDYDNIASSGVGGSALYYAAYNFNYNDPGFKAEIANIWSVLYNNIANINNILGQIDASKRLFTADNYQRIKGEALGLRALFHFDAVRLFGQPPLIAGTTPAVPYVKSFTIQQTPLYSVPAVLDSCLSDLAAARSLLATTDTSAVYGATSDPFTSYTQNHLNYWAINGLMARVWLYAGNTESANDYAQMVIGSNKFPLIKTNVASSTNIPRDRTYSQEHLFSLYSQNIGNYSLSMFELQSPNTPIVLNITATGKNNPFASPTTDNVDWRMRSWFDPIPGAANQNNLVPSKFYQDANLPYNLQGLMPVIRVSEMYYIAAEFAVANGDIATGVSYINSIRQARGLSVLNPAGISTTDSVSHLIRNEYKKEFFMEGQTFFYYKRLNLNLNTYAGNTGLPVILPPSPFVFPLPDAEKQYRGL